jgi:hypothetical protein
MAAANGGIGEDGGEYMDDEEEMMGDEDEEIE